MADKPDKIDHLTHKLEYLLKKQEEFSQEIENLRTEIESLKTQDKSQAFETKKTENEYNPPQPKAKQQSPDVASSTATTSSKIKSNLEKFIGENLINKIGIAITVIGIAIGAQYAIDNELISPLTRIILGYLAGVALLGFAVRLRKKYKDFSAVLLSGSIAIMYFITYVAFSFYAIIPQTVAFTLMVIFTVFTVIAAISYDRQVIAHIGLVGAYAAPFLLSDGSGRVTILFSYMAIINGGILAIAFKKYWKSLYYSSFGITWLIYIVWYVFRYQSAQHFNISLTFLSLFFVIFYLTFLAYKLLQKEKFQFNDILLLLANSFVFYGMGYAIISSHTEGESALGLFTLCNAIVHFLVSIIIYRQKLADRDLFFFVSGLALVFIAIAIPVQLDGNWVTLLWVGEAALLFRIGRTRSIPAYEKLSYPLMVLSFFSIVHDWVFSYGIHDFAFRDISIEPVFNIHFLSSLLFTGAFGFINFVHYNKKFSSPPLSKRNARLIAFIIPTILIVTLYYTFYLEIANYWNQLIAGINSGSEQYINKSQKYNLAMFKTVWLINYSLLFVSILSFVNIKKLRKQQLGLINLGLNTLTVAVFLIQGLYVLSELREIYLQQNLSGNVFNVGIRYVSYAFVTATLIACYQYIRQDFIKLNLKVPFDILLYTSILWLASSELINWMDIIASAQSYKLGLSILWGIYALMLIALGIWKKKKHLRIAAIVLFGVTLIKLFFYDISHLDTIAKTIVFVSLGILLLIISFLYNKYKHVIADEV